MTHPPVVSIIGRPNVGKSSLFNGLMQERFRSLTFNTPGVTRDRHYSILSLKDSSTYDPVDIILIDTGGFYPEKVPDNDKSFFKIIREQSEISLKESDLILLVVNIRDGLTLFDKNINEYLRSMNKTFWVLANKCDTDKQDGDENEFYSLGIESSQLFKISAVHNRGIQALREQLHIYAHKRKGIHVLQSGLLPDRKISSKVAIIGVQNAGKSTLLNQLMGVERAIVSKEPGTTLDPVQGYFNLDFGKEVSLLKELPSEELNLEEDSWRSIPLLDTAGIRKKARVEDPLEAQSIYRSLRCIGEADIVIYVVDSLKGVGHQDKRLIDIALLKGRSLILCLNKFDLLKLQYKTKRDREEWLMDLRDRLPWMSYCDMLCLSARDGIGLQALRDSLKKTILVRNSSIKTSSLNKFMEELIDRNPIVPLCARGTKLKIKYISMIKSSPPTFILFANRSKGISEQYRRYIKSALRKKFDLYNSPIHLMFRSGKNF